MKFKDLYKEKEEFEDLTYDELMEVVLEYEEMFENIQDILDEIFDDDDDEITEIIKRVRIDPKTKRERKKAYRLNKHKIKRKADKYRKTSKYKLAQKKYKRISSLPGYKKKKFV